MQGAGHRTWQGDGAASPLRRRAYAQAQRHSRRVRFFKRAIPLGSAIAVVVVAAAALFNPFRQVEGLTLGPVSLSGTHVTMESPRLTGFRKDSQPYEVTASAAMQDVRQPNLVELKDLKARVVMDDKGGTARLEAISGLFDTQKEQLELRQSVRVRTDNGQDVRLQSASVDFKAGTVVSRDPVTVSLGNGIIEANGIEVLDNGKVMTFTGRVRSTFEPADGSTTTSQGGAPTATGSASVEPASQSGATSVRP